MCDEVCIRQSPRNVIALRHRIFKPIGGRNNGVVGIEKGKAQTCKTEDSYADKLAASDASGGCVGQGRGGIGSGGGLLIHGEKGFWKGKEQELPGTEEEERMKVGS